MTRITIEIGPVEGKAGYYRYVASMVFLVCGLVLLLEHLITWGRFDPGFGGHEVVGLVSIVLGYFLGIGLRFRKNGNGV